MLFHADIYYYTIIFFAACVNTLPLAAMMLMPLLVNTSPLLYATLLMPSSYAFHFDYYFVTCFLHAPFLHTLRHFHDNIAYAAAAMPCLLILFTLRRFFAFAFA